MKVYGKKKETAATAKVKLAAKYSNRDMDWKVFIRYLFARHQNLKLLILGNLTHAVVTKTTDSVFCPLF